MSIFWHVFAESEKKSRTVYDPLCGIHTLQLFRKEEMMKRFVVFYALVIVLIFACSVSAQENPVYFQKIVENPIDPYQAQAWEDERRLNEAGPTEMKAVSVSNIAAEMLTKPTLGGKAKYKVTFDTETHGEVTKMTYGLLTIDHNDTYSWVHYKNKDLPETNPQTFETCEIVTSGDYWLYMSVIYADGEQGRIDEKFTIEDDDSHISLTEKINEVVSSCRADTAWQTALNLHDWLTHNIYYDYSLEYHGSDGILRGYGVCDTYSKAYMLLCRAAGIPVGRVMGGNHAWNGIQLDGEWYFVDPTWNDPGRDEVPESGKEYHAYFCINEDALTEDHTIEEYEDAIVGSCTSMDMNYYVVTGEWQNWGPNSSDTYLSYILDAFDQGNSSFSFDTSVWVYEKGSSSPMINSYKPLFKKVLVYGLNKDSLIMSDGEQVKVHAEADFTETKTATVSLRGWDITESGTLVLPADLISIEDSSFYDTGATTVEIPSGCTSIGAGAFANSKVRTMVIPDSVASIDNTAFDGCGRIIFKTSNSAAKEYAVNHSMMVVVP